MIDLAVLPVAGDVSALTATQLSGGQPLLVCRDGIAVAVLVDLDSWAEIEAVVSADDAAE
jgi:hypothetical protein